jgi:hypothetical protein
MNFAPDDGGLLFGVDPQTGPRELFEHVEKLGSVHPSGVLRRRLQCNHSLLVRSEDVAERAASVGTSKFERAVVSDDF